jgi:polyferredoxin
MECVNCTACIDACDSVMDKVGLDRGLIRYASLNGIEKGQALRFTARMKLYSVVLTGLITLFLVLVFTRSDVETALLRAPGTLFQETGDGHISNIYTLRVVNKTAHDIPVELKLLKGEGKIQVLGASQFIVAKESSSQTSVLIAVEKSHLNGPSTPLEVGVYSKGKLLETVKTAFVGPRK